MLFILVFLRFSYYKTSLSHWPPDILSSDSHVTNVSTESTHHYWHCSTQCKWSSLHLAKAGMAKAGMVHSVSRWMRCVQVKLWDPLRMRAIPEQLRGVFTIRCYTNTRLPLPYLNSPVRTAAAGCIELPCLLTIMKLLGHFYVDSFMVSANANSICHVACCSRPSESWYDYYGDEHKTSVVQQWAKMARKMW